MSRFDPYEWLVRLGDLGLGETSVSTEVMRQIRVISVTTIVMCSIGLLSVGQFWKLNMPDIALLTAGTIVLGIINLGLLRVTRRPELSGHVAIAILTSIIVITSISVGGYYHPNFSWFYVIPLTAIVVVGLRGALVWTVLAVAGMTMFWLLPDLGIDLPNRIPPELDRGNALFTRVMAILAIAGLGGGFVFAQRRAERQLAKVNEWHRREAAYLELVMHTTACANEAISFESAMQESVERICNTMGFFGGHVCKVNEDGTIVSGGYSYMIEPGEHRELKEITEKRVCQPGEGISGRAVANRAPEYVISVANPELDGRAAMASEMGFRSALAVPIFVSGEIPAVLEFVSAEELPDADHLVDVFFHIGVQLGRVAERAALQDRVRQAQKMEAVGQLAAGIAHEINNPMAYVRSNLCSLRDEWDERSSALLRDVVDPGRLIDSDEIREMIDDSLEGVERTIEIVRGLSEFSHSGGARSTEWKVNDLRALLDRALRVASAHAPSGVTFEQECKDEVLCFCSANQITQVLVNLIVNAVQAVGDRGAIRLTSGREGSEVFVRIEDDGPGMSEVTRRRLFDPFFTTKSVGEGTGLGLSVSYEIMRSHRGEIRVQSEPGAGASFEIRLPGEA